MQASILFLQNRFLMDLGGVLIYHTVKRLQKQCHKSWLLNGWSRSSKKFRASILQSFLVGTDIEPHYLVYLMLFNGETCPGLVIFRIQREMEFLLQKHHCAWCACHLVKRICIPHLKWIVTYKPGGLRFSNIINQRIQHLSSIWSQYSILFLLCFGYWCQLLLLVWHPSRNFLSYFEAMMRMVSILFLFCQTQDIAVFAAFPRLPWNYFSHWRNNKPEGQHCTNSWVPKCEILGVLLIPSLGRNVVGGQTIQCLWRTLAFGHVGPFCTNTGSRVHSVRLLWAFQACLLDLNSVIHVAYFIKVTSLLTGYWWVVQFLRISRSENIHSLPVFPTHVAVFSLDF